MNTIAAISTPVGIGGLGIIRISGPDAFAIIPRIFLSRKHGKKFSAKKQATHTVHFGFLMYKTKKIDECLMSLYKAPHTYTGEDSVEFTCHGGALVLESALSAILDTGKARLAKQGEYTKKAFLNGRIDLVQSEAVADIIEARTLSALDNAVSQLEGRLSREIRLFREPLLQILSTTEARIEFPEDTDDEISGKTYLKKIARTITGLLKKIHNLIMTFETGSLMHQGINVAIVGAPNSGKSTLLNALLGFERAIVTSIPGTTRDFLKESLVLEGTIVNFIDTAGMRRARDDIEKKGLSMTHEKIMESTIIMHVVDGSRPLSANDKQVHETTSGKKNRILILNKSDKGLHPSLKKSIRGYRRRLTVSAKCHKGMDKVQNELIRILKEQNTLYDSQKNIISNARHKNALENCAHELSSIQSLIRTSSPEDMIAQGLHNAIRFLDDLTGKATPDEILNRIFARFCIGK